MSNLFMPSLLGKKMMMLKGTGLLGVMLVLLAGSPAWAGTVTSASDSGPDSLRDIIVPAAADETIDFALGSSPSTISLASPINLPVNDLTIDGGALGRLTIDGGNAHQIFTWANSTGNELKLENLFFKQGRSSTVALPNANSSAFGGVLSAYTNFGTGPDSILGSIDSTTWTGNSATAVASAVGPGKIGVSAQAYGGAISLYAYGNGVHKATLGDISGSAWISNSATATSNAVGTGISGYTLMAFANVYGGAISLYASGGDSQVGNVSGSTWTSNHAIANGDHTTWAYAYGSAISSFGWGSNSYIGYNSDGTKGRITSSVFASNTSEATAGIADAFGGAVSSYGDSSSIGDITNSTWTSNRVIATGNAIIETTYPWTGFQGPYISGYAHAYGGAISSYASSGPSTLGDISGSIWAGNEAIATANSVFITASNAFTKAEAYAYGGATSLRSGNASIMGNITNGSEWTGNHVIANGDHAYKAYAYGGAISNSLGINSYIGYNADGTKGHIDGDSVFDSNTAEATGIKANSLGGAISSYGDSSSFIGDVNLSTWTNNRTTATATAFIESIWQVETGTLDVNANASAYGGALSSYANGNVYLKGISTLGDIKSATWTGNYAIATANAVDQGGGYFTNAQAYAYGGAISSAMIGSFYYYGGDAQIGNISNGSVWTDNHSKANGYQTSFAYAYGGAISSYDNCGNSYIGYNNDGTKGNIGGSATFGGNTAEAVGNTASAFGGGISSYGDKSAIGNINLSTWTNNQAKATAPLINYSNSFIYTSAYGGALSSYAFSNYMWSTAGPVVSTIGDISGATWTGNYATATANNTAGGDSYPQASAYGGAISSVKISTYRGDSQIGNISNGSTWTDNHAIANGVLAAKAYAYGGAISSYTNGGNSSIGYNADGTKGSISGNSTSLIGNTAEATVGGNLPASLPAYLYYNYAYAYGGAASSYTASGNSTIGDISRVHLGANLVKAKASTKNAFAYAYGGALSSAVGQTTAGIGSSIGAITSGSTWEGNSVIASAEETATTVGTGSRAYAYGGAIYTTALGDPLIIRGSSFTGNKAIASGTVGLTFADGGAIFVSTTLGTQSAASVISLEASDSETTLFQANSVEVNGVTIPNSITFGRSLGNNSLGNAVLNISPDVGGTVALYDPINVDINNGHSFTMNVNGPGTFIWGGINSLNVIGSGTDTVNLNNGTIILQPDFRLTSSAGDLTVNISPDVGNTVNVSDPIRVGVSNNHSFTMNINGPGKFIWGGVNQLDVSGVGTNTVNFNSGRVFLRPDFTLKSSTNNLAVNLTGGSSGIALLPNLTGRNQSLAIFDSPKYFSVTGGPVVIDPIYTGPYFSGSRSWLLTILPTNAIGTVTPANFTTASNIAFTSSISQTDANLYIVLGTLAITPPPVDPPPIDPQPVVSPTAPPSVLTSLGLNLSPNVRSAFSSGALDAAWNAQRAVLNPALHGAALNVLNTHPQLFTGEAFINQGFTALNITGNLADRAWQLSRQSPLPFGNRIDPSNTVNIRPWAGYTWNSFTQDSTAGHFGFNSAMNGGLGGFSADIGPRATLSFYGASAGGNTSSPDLQSGVNSSTTQAGGLFSYAILPQLQIGVESGYTKITNEGARGTPFGNYTSSFGQTVAIQGASIGFDIPFGINTQLSIVPRVRHLRLDQDAINESGANPTWALHTGSPIAEALVSTVATTLSHDFIFGNGMSVTTSLNTEYKHQSGDATLETTASLGSNSPVSSLSSVPQDRDAVKVGASVTTVLYSFYGGINVVAELEYAATTSNNATDHVYHAGINVEF